MINIKDTPEAIATLEDGTDVTIDGRVYRVGTTTIGWPLVVVGIYFYTPDRPEDNDEYLRLTEGHRYAAAEPVTWINAIKCGWYTHDADIPVEER